MAERSTLSTNGMTSNAHRPLFRQHIMDLRQKHLPANMWALVAATAMLGLAYAPNFRDLYSIWNDDPNYSHGKLVIPISLFILWRRLSEKSPKQLSTNLSVSWGGWVFLAVILVVRAIAYEVNSQWMESATIDSGDCLHHMDFWWLVAIAACLAGHSVPGLFASPATIGE